MITFNLHLKATHTYASLAPTWIVDYRPVWYYFEGTKTYHGVIAIGNPFLWWLATLSLVATVVLALLRRSYALLPAAAPSSSSCTCPWFLTTRTSFLYYMTPVAPFMAILVAGGALPVRRRRAAAPRLARRRRTPRWPPPCSGSRSASPRAGCSGRCPRRAGDSLGWVGVTVGVAARARRRWCSCSRRACGAYRPWLAMVVAGLIIGIVVAFMPIVLGLPHLARVLRAHHVVPQLDLTGRSCRP